MAQESRVKKSLLNARVNLFFYFLTLAFTFFSRRIFLDALGADFIGLTGTLYNLLGFLNLAELGIGSAIGYVLYKPLFDHDQSRINEIISVMGYLYRWIGFIILGAGCVLACFLPLIFPNTGFDLSLIYFAYFAFLTSSLIGYFINYRQNLLGADQRNYVVTAYFQTSNIIKLLIQMASAYYTGNYYLWVAIELTFGIIYSFILNWKINQTYPWLRSEVRQGRQLFRNYPEVMKYTKQLFIHKMCMFTQYQTMPIFIYSFVSLQIVAFFNNYTIIIDKLVGIFINVLGGIEASVGNLIAEGNTNKIESVFFESFTIHAWFSCMIAYLSFLFIEPIIELWLGKTYILPKSILIILCMRIYVLYLCAAVDAFLRGYGLFSDIWASILQAAIFVVCATIGGYLYGLDGIIASSIISIATIQGLWRPYFLYKKGFKLPLFHYWGMWLKINIINISSVFISYYIGTKIVSEYISSNSYVLFPIIFFIFFLLNLSGYLRLVPQSKQILVRINHYSFKLRN